MGKDKLPNFYSLKINKRESNIDFIISKIKELLLTKKLLPGDKLPSEFELSKIFSVSRGSIREAMKILSAFGIIEIRSGDGTYISKKDKNIQFDPLLFSLIINYKDFGELFELRELLEISIVKLILRHPNTKELKKVEKILLDSKEELLSNQNIDHKVMAEYDISFHVTLSKAAGNILVEKIYNFTLDLFRDSIESTYKKPKNATNAITLHENIYNAIIEKNIDNAIKAISESMEQWKIFYK